MKILVVALDNVGDTVMATAVFPLLRDAYPGCGVGVWVKEYTAGLFDESTVVSRVHASDPFWDKSPGRSSGSFFKFFRTLHDIKREKYDAAIILNTEWRRAAACWWAGIPARIGFNRRKSKIFLTQAVPVPPPGHFIDDHRRLIEGWLGKEFDWEMAKPLMDVSEEQSKSLLSWQDHHGWRGKSLIVLHPFAGNPLRHWPLSKWAELAGSLAAAHPDLRFGWVAGPGQDKDLEVIQTTLGPNRSHIFLNLSLGFIKAALRQAAVFVGVDSGPAHMAAAIGTPGVVLFGPTDPGRCGPTGNKPLVILRENPISQIDPASVRNEVEKFL